MPRAFAPDRPPSRLQTLLAGAPGWVGGALTAVQGAAITLFLVLAPALAAAAAAPTPDGSASIDWGATGILSVRLWLLGHGVPLEAGGVTFTLAPLGLGMIAIGVLRSVARAFCTKSWASWAVASAGYAGVVATVTAVTFSGDGATAASFRAGAVAFAMAAPATAWGIWRAHGAEFAWLVRVPAMVRVGLRLGAGVLAAFLAAGAVIGAGFTFLGRGRIADAVSHLGIDPLGGVALAFGEALYAPNIAVWMVGWASGQGFVVGEGSLYSPGAVTADALPAFPLLGAMPHTSGGPLVWAPPALAAVAFAAYALARRRIGRTTNDLYALAIAVLVTTAGMAVAGAVASGALGPGRLATAGVEVVPVCATVGALAAVGLGAGHGLAYALAWLRGRRAPRLSVVRQDEPQDATV